MKTKSQKVNTGKAILSALLITSLLSMPSMAYEQIQEKKEEQRNQQKTDNENIGFGTGAVIGAVIAGPIGAFVAGITGVFIAKHINVNDDVEQLSLALTQAKKNHLFELEQSQSKFELAQQNYQAELTSLIDEEKKKTRFTDSLQAENLLMSLQFSTGSSEISAHYQEQVSAVAQVLNDSPLMKIDLSGYTDLEGDSNLNQKLSQARVESVKELLMAQGVSENQISVFAYGEKSPVVATDKQQISFYDRRVVLKLHNPLGQVAKR